jgi:uncharacterized sulfatase
MKIGGRRDFIRTCVSGTGSLLAASKVRGAPSLSAQGHKSPNFLWISVEDISPDLGCYGDSYAVTPNLDKLAAQGVRYTNAFTPAGVCAPVRSSVITGMYQSSIGTCPMRCRGVPPPAVRCFTEYLRATGYYCTNRSKTDYQFEPPLTAWDDCGPTAYWRNRPHDLPFFSVVNLTTTHESQIRSEERHEDIATLGPREKHDPARAELPPYYPDTERVRRDWAQYYDIITLMDKQVARILEDLADDGLAGETIVFFWSDHGRGLPRAKRWVYDSGMRVPLIIRVPEQLRAQASPGNPGAVAPGFVDDQLVSFVDLAPTMLALAGVAIPAHFQGRAFLGRRNTKPRQYVYGARDRIDEAFDLVRSVNDGRYVYVRNFMWHRTYGQDVEYMNKMPTMQEMRRLHAAGRLSGTEALYFRPRRDVEELYDLETDPHEVENVAADPVRVPVLARMRAALVDWMKEIQDVGLIPEPDFDALKRPDDIYEVTAMPRFSPDMDARQGKQGRVSIACATPGASIAFRFRHSSAVSNWMLYFAPVLLKPEEALEAKACRLGFTDSPVTTYRLGQPATRSQALTQSRPHWKQRVPAGLLDHLLAIKSHDGQGAAAVPAYLAALRDPHGAARYWAVVGLHTECVDAALIDKAKLAVRPLLDDPSVSVRVAAAQAICHWGETDEGLRVLVDVLAQGHGSARHLAIAALRDLGEKAHPALPQMRAALEDEYDNVVLMATHALRGLGELE